MPGILVVDDHAIVLEGAREIFGTHDGFRLTGLVGSGEEALDQVERERPDVILMDYRMPGMDGATATSLLLLKAPRARVIAFSGFSCPSAVEAMWTAGARGFVVKESRPEDLLAAAQSVWSGGCFYSAELGNALPLRSLARSGLEGGLEEPCALSVCERRIVTLLASGLRNKEVAAELNLAVRTIEKYREALMQKLRLQSLAGLVKYALRNGLATLDPD